MYIFLCLYFYVIFRKKSLVTCMICMYSLYVLLLLFMDEYVSIILFYIFFRVSQSTSGAEFYTNVSHTYTGWPAKKYQIFPGHNFFINWVRNLKQISLESVYLDLCLWYNTFFQKYYLLLQYKSRFDLQSSWLHDGEHRERWTLWLQPLLL